MLSSGRCAGCGAVVDHGVIATGVIDIDTTGLPAGVTFGTLGNAVTQSAVTQHEGAAPDSRGPLTVGQALGPRYHIIKLLGTGGMGAVYQAWDAELGVAVALKVIRGDSRRAASPDAEKRFKQELLLARQVTHKNVVRIHDLGEIDDIKYLTMPYVQGHDLAALLRSDGRCRSDGAGARSRAISRRSAGEYEAGVVHRDLKPPTSWSRTRSNLHALIMDFGISASADAQSSDTDGTLEYMVLSRPRGTADARADIYAFGLISSDAY